MRERYFLGCLFSLICSIASAQVPVADLFKPPPNARHFIIASAGVKHGDSWRWLSANGNRVGREKMNLRGQVWDVEHSGTTETAALLS
jgi:hypothetical protein